MTVPLVPSLLDLAVPDCGRLGDHSHPLLASIRLISVIYGTIFSYLFFVYHHPTMDSAIERADGKLKSDSAGSYIRRNGHFERMLSLIIAFTIVVCLSFRLDSEACQILPSGWQKKWIVMSGLWIVANIWCWNDVKSRSLVGKIRTTLESGSAKNATIVKDSAEPAKNDPEAERRLARQNDLEHGKSLFQVLSNSSRSRNRRKETHEESSKSKGANVKPKDVKLKEDSAAEPKGSLSRSKAEGSREKSTKGIKNVEKPKPDDTPNPSKETAAGSQGALSIGLVIRTLAVFVAVLLLFPTPEPLEVLARALFSHSALKTDDAYSDSGILKEAGQIHTNQGQLSLGTDQDTQSDNDQKQASNVDLMGARPKRSQYLDSEQTPFSLNRFSSFPNDPASFPQFSTYPRGKYCSSDHSYPIDGSPFSDRLGLSNSEFNPFYQSFSSEAPTHDLAMDGESRSFPNYTSGAKPSSEPLWNMTKPIPVYSSSDQEGYEHNESQ